VIDIAQIYDEFGFGRRDPEAIRHLLAFAYDNWRGPSGTEDPPSYVLLLGDATPDYEDNQNLADWVDQVPTPIMLHANSIIGYYASDNWLASFRGDDQIPDVYLGRISARSAALVAGVLNKIRLYESSPPPGLWKGRAVLAASDGDSAIETQTFEDVQTGVATTYFTTPPYTAQSLYFGQPPYSSMSSNAGQFKSDLVAAINNGRAIVSYVGHGAFEIMGNNAVLFSSADAAMLTNAPYLPLFVAFDCLAGGFHAFSLAGSVAEAMVNNGNGGSVAALSPAGLSSALTGDVLSDELFRHLLGKEKARDLGLVQSELHAALWTQGRIIDAQGLAFLGDPATRFVMPAPPAPTGLAAVAGNSQVSLTWTAPAQPVAGYRVYRATGNPLAAYTLACSPGVATSCVDTGVVNATRYYYYAVSIDQDLFEGPASNLNGDCDAGPGCVTARPVNPNPPVVPTIQSIVDTGTGASLQVNWQASGENDIQKYTLRYGSQPGDYPLTIVAAPNATSAVLTGLSQSVRYYVVMTATNTSGLESAPSAPMSGVPHLVQGIAPPMAISDLRLAASGPNLADLTLTWTRPTLDIYGRPTTVTGYKVYRGTTPGFMVVGSTPLVTIGSGATTTYTDSQAMVNPASYYYVVTASDAQGFNSGGGRDLPNGISDLQVSMVSGNPNLLHLAWTPPTTDFQGFATLIDHYQVHVTSVPVRRESLNASTIVLDNVPGPSVDLGVTGSPRYISVLAVDNRGNLSPF
jgi:fibronectin type 3 domain-containing protein